VFNAGRFKPARIADAHLEAVRANLVWFAEKSAPVEGAVFLPLTSKYGAPETENTGNTLQKIQTVRWYQK